MEWPLHSIQHIHFGTDSLVGDEHKISGKRWKLDGFIESETHRQEFADQFGWRDEWEARDKPTVGIEFLGDVYHGNPALDRNKSSFRGKKYGDLYDKTMCRFDDITALGYVIFYIWERDFRAWLREVKNAKSVAPTLVSRLIRHAPTTSSSSSIDNSPMEIDSLSSEDGDCEV